MYVQVEIKINVKKSLNSPYLIGIHSTINHSFSMCEGHLLAWLPSFYNLKLLAAFDLQILKL